MALRRPVLGSLALAIAGLWFMQAPTDMQEQLVFVVPQSPALRATAQFERGVAGAPKTQTDGPATVMQALPEPKPNDAMLPVELNRTSFFWGMLTFCLLSVLFSSYLFN
eukprot:TRINITY_DN3706_c0_g1_i3.p1 TRINITY_DN3706_c0_g1~~TRINITY_DN3706_c0_g1_i3.p1  ORF type:complete len:109 (-),score=16.11 TRINITY_DN3706_c0_g1_i3:218-544(-)